MPQRPSQLRDRWWWWFVFVTPVHFQGHGIVTLQCKVFFVLRLWIYSVNCFLFWMWVIWAFNLLLDLLKCFVTLFTLTLKCCISCIYCYDLFVLQCNFFCHLRDILWTYNLIFLHIWGEIKRKKKNLMLDMHKVLLLFFFHTTAFPFGVFFVFFFLSFLTCFTVLVATLCDYRHFFNEDPAVSSVFSSVSFIYVYYGVCEEHSFVWVDVVTLNGSLRSDV